MTNHFLDRLKGRIKYGLLTQEILDGFGRLGVRVTPYVIVDESPGASLDIQLEAADYIVRTLTADDIALIANMPGRKRDLNKTLARLDDSECLGIFVNGTLAGYTWSRYDRISRSKGRIELHVLKPDEAYLFDMYVDKPFRGMALAPLLRHRSYRHVLAKEVRRFYSITPYFNRSSRKFKAKLGARELELRVGLKLWSLMDADFRIRRYEADNPLETKRVYFVRG